MALFYSTWLYITLQLLYFTLFDSTCLPFSFTIVLLHSTSHYITLLLPYDTLLEHYITLPCMVPIESTLLYHCSTPSTWFHIILPWFYFTLQTRHYSILAIPNSTWLYINLPWLYFIPPDSTLLFHGSASLFHGSTSIHLHLHYSTMALLHSTWLYITLPLLYHGCTSFY